jgi:hypothetical protein
VLPNSIKVKVGKLFIIVIYRLKYNKIKIDITKWSEIYPLNAVRDLLLLSAKLVDFI